MSKRSAQIRLYFGKITAALAFVYLLPLSETKAQDLFITPKRVILDAQKRSQEINLANTGNDTARYAISFIQIRMKDDGSFEEIKQPDPGQNFADKYLRIFPRTVTLAPKEAQVVRVQINPASKLAPGEYRSHLYFRALTAQNPLGEKPANKDSSGLSVRLKPVFGISIPIIIRTGTADVAVSISEAAFEKINGNPFLSIQLNRKGNMSVYGDLSVEHVANNGKVTRVGLIKGLAVYTPNSLRKVKIKLVEGVNYHSGKLRIRFQAPAEEKSGLLASGELLLK